MILKSVISFWLTLKNLCYQLKHISPWSSFGWSDFLSSNFLLNILQHWRTFIRYHQNWIIYSNVCLNWRFIYIQMKKSAFIIVCSYLHLQVYENNQIFEGWRNKFPSILMIPLFTQSLSLLRKHSMFTKKYKTTVQPRYFSSKILHNMQCTYEIIPSNKYHVSCCKNTNERQANRRHWQNLMIKVVRPI